MTWIDLRRALATNGSQAGPLTAPAAGNAEVTGVTHDSRLVRPGSVFVALKGQHADGAAFVQQAVTQGAVAVVTVDNPPELANCVIAPLGVATVRLPRMVPLMLTPFSAIELMGGESCPDELKTKSTPAFCHATCGPVAFGLTS